MTRVLLLVFFLLAAIACAHSASVKRKDANTHSEDISDMCNKDKAPRFFEWGPCSSKFKGVQKGIMRHFEIRDGKCVELYGKVKRTCPHVCKNREVEAGFCKKKNGKEYSKGREVKVTKYVKVKGVCKKKVIYKQEACAKHIPWITCPKLKKMEFGKCVKSKYKKNQGLREIIVKEYERKDEKHLDCRSHLKKKWEVCTNYKKTKGGKKGGKKAGKKAAKKAAKKP